VRLKILVVDDEPLAREGLRMLLAEDPYTAGVIEARNGPEAVRLIEEQRPDLVLLDVQMPRMDGFQVIDAVGAVRMPAVIFVTAWDKYALRAFEVNAIDYLLKPVHEDRLRSALERTRARLVSEPEGAATGRMLSLLESIAHPRNYLKRLAIRLAARTIFVDTEEVDWISAAENYVEVHVKDKNYLLHVPIGTLEAALDPATFLRVHRSAIVNISRVRSLTPATHGQYVMALESGAQVQSGRAYSDAVRALTVNRF
jgi:two-component system LytT family response regulator